MKTLAVVLYKMYSHLSADLPLAGMQGTLERFHSQNILLPLFYESTSVKPSQSQRPPLCQASHYCQFNNYQYIFWSLWASTA